MSEKEPIENYRQKISLKAYAKINLSIDVLGKLPTGYHEVEMVMQQISLCDEVSIEVTETTRRSEAPLAGDYEIRLTANKKWLPCDNSNIAYKAAALMIETYRPNFHGRIEIHLQKGIPVAAGLAGGSADAAAVLRGLKELWQLPLSLAHLMELGLKLGADVPFCIMGQQAAAERQEALAAGLASRWTGTPETPAGTCALAQGIGEKLTVLKPLNSLILLSKPRYSASTAAVYGGLDLNHLLNRPNTPLLLEGLKENNRYKVTAAMGNVLESVTSRLVPQVAQTRALLQQQPGVAKVLMSGSGPSVYGIFTNRHKAERARRQLAALNAETYLVKTLI